MKKYKILGFVLIVCIVVCTVFSVFNTKTFTAEAKAAELLEKISMEEIAEQNETDLLERFSNHYEVGGVVSILEDAGYYLDDINFAMEKYVNASVLYNMSENENDYIMTLLDLGYDFEKLIDIYTYIQMTPNGIECIREIYDIADGNFESSTWLENAYDVYLGDKKCVLTTEDIAYYATNGIPIADIVKCYELSLNGIKNLREILDERVQGYSWYDIMQPVYELPVVDEDKQLNLDTILEAVKLSINTSMNVSEIILDNGELEFSEESIVEFNKRTNMLNSILQKLEIENELMLDDSIEDIEVNGGGLL